MIFCNGLTLFQVKSFNTQLNEQKKAVAKISKLCLGALNAVDQLETKIGHNSDETAKNQPMEKIKKLSEETVRLNTMMSQMDLYLGNVPGSPPKLLQFDIMPLTSNLY